MSAEPVLEPGWVADPLTAEFPELRVLSCVVGAPARGRDPGVARHLGVLAERFTGARAVELRREPVPAAYRVFYRHVGLDPDLTRTPIEAAALDRLVAGGHASRGRLADALLIALLETGVPVTAVDEQRVRGPAGLRAARPDERLGAGADALPLPAGRLVLADAERPIAELFGDVADDVRPGRRSRRLRLIAVRIPGVPEIHVEESLWACQEALGTSPPEE